ncbi:MAG: DUF721 domain-containing protein [Pigmentiphaga sp.]|nr:DUF721 domain-containing protein [Pigmentiphaga sp.]
MKMNSTSRRHTTPDAVSWLNNSQRGASLLATAQRLAALQRDVQRILPEPLASACQVLKWQEDRLQLGIPTAAHSAKLRQVVPRLVQGLQQHGWQVNEIRVRVQAPVALEPPQPHRGPHADLDAQALAAFTELQAQLPAGGPLHDAVERLLKRRAASAAQDQGNRSV